MTNSKTTKRALVASILLLLLCVSMLIGSTFAWFTDSATTGTNKITAGNLDVILEYNTDCGSTWTNAEAATDIFTTDKWEPGFTQVVYFKVTNNGSLAFDYKVATNIVKETAGKNQKGNDFNLSDHLLFGIVETTSPFTTRDLARAAVETPSKFSAVQNGEKVLTSGDNQIFAMVVWMPESTDNTANHNGINVPEIQFGINVIASQATVENDSYDDRYDANAEFEKTEEGTVVNVGGINIPDDETLVIKGGNVNDYKLIESSGNGVVINNINFEGTAVVWGAGGTVTINGGNFKATAIAVKDSVGLPVIINGGYFDVSSIDASTGSDVTINGGTFTCDPTGFVAEGKTAVNNNDGTWTVK